MIDRLTDDELEAIADGSARYSDGWLVLAIIAIALIGACAIAYAVMVG